MFGSSLTACLKENTTADLRTHLCNWREDDNSRGYVRFRHFLQGAIHSSLWRQQQHWQGWNQFGLTRVFLSAPRHDWCAPLSHPSSSMLVNHGPSQQSSKEEYKPWKWGATARYYTSHTKTMLPTRKSVPRSSRHSDHTKTSWPSQRDTDWSGMNISAVCQVWP